MLTPIERHQIVQLVVCMFDVAPGATHLQDLSIAYEAGGRSLLLLARTLGQTSAFKSLHPAHESATDFGASLLGPLGLAGNATAIDFVVAKFNAGEDKGQIAFSVMAALDATTDPAFAGAKALLANRTAVAEYASVDLGVNETSIVRLHGLLDGVTQDPASVASAESALDAIYRPAIGGGQTGAGTGSGSSSGTGTGAGAGTGTDPGTGSGNNSSSGSGSGSGSGSSTGSGSGSGSSSGSSNPNTPLAEQGGSAAPDPDPDPAGGGVSTPDPSSEHMDPGTPDPAAPVWVWDNDTQMWVPGAARVDRVGAYGAGHGHWDAPAALDGAHAAAVMLVGLAGLDTAAATDGVSWA